MVRIKTNCFFLLNRTQRKQKEIRMPLIKYMYDRKKDICEIAIYYFTVIKYDYK